MILEILDGWGSLAGAEFLSLRAFLAFFAKYLPLDMSKANEDLSYAEVCKYINGRKTCLKHLL